MQKNTDPENLENPENPENRGSSINSENTIHSRKSNKKQSYDVGVFWVKKSPPKGGVFRGESAPFLKTRQFLKIPNFEKIPNFLKNRQI